jgi:Flp pilus assembly protein TadG
MKAHSQRFWRTSSGASAVEFAVLSPVLAFLVLGLMDLASMASSAISLRGGLQAAAGYVMQGGTDDAQITAIAESTWSSAPDDANISIARSCACGATAVSCTAVCTSGSKTPASLVHLTASWTWTGPFTTDFLPISAKLSQERVVRVR